MAEASFSPRETVFSPINPSLYNSIFQLTLHRSPCPSAPSERLGAGGSVAATDALPPTEAWYKLHLLDLKPRKVGPGSHLPLCPQESRHKHPASQQPATSPNSQQSHPPTTHTPPPHHSPPPGSTAVTSALPPRGVQLVRDGAGHGLQHLPEQDLALLRGLGVKLDAGPPRKLPGWKRLLL